MKAFTLIEVLIATIIVLVASAVILSTSSNAKRLFILLEESKDFSLKSSIALIEQKDVKNLYEEAVDFNISDDDIISTLKKEKIALTSEIQNDMEFNLSDKPIHLIIRKITAYNDNFSNSVYSIEVK
ncbi:MAG: type II secretion system protein [Epsilonproteobacteria bacterium]|nr:type II secretion system protein [Campylobacterota bacterium]